MKSDGRIKYLPFGWEKENDIKEFRTHAYFNTLLIIHWSRNIRPDITSQLADTIAVLTPYSINGWQKIAYEAYR